MHMSLEKWLILIGVFYKCSRINTHYSLVEKQDGDVSRRTTSDAIKKYESELTNIDLRNSQ